MGIDAIVYASGIRACTVARRLVAALGKSEFGLYSVICVMTVIVMLANTMRLVRWNCCGDVPDASKMV